MNAKQKFETAKKAYDQAQNAERRNTYRVHSPHGGADIAIHGDTPEQAVAENLGIVDALHCCAGYVVLGIEATNKAGILGGRGGIEVIVRYRAKSRDELGTGYLPQHQIIPAAQQSVLWMEATR